MAGLRREHLIHVVAVATGAFHVYTAGFGIFATMVQRPLHLLFMAVLAFLLFPPSGGKGRGGAARQGALAGVVSGLLLAVAVVANGYLILNFHTFADRVGNVTTLEVVLGIAMTLAVLEAARRAMGWVLPLVCLAFVAYALAGHWIPGVWGHAGFSLERLVRSLYLGTRGLYGVPLSVSAAYITNFVIFSAVLGKYGVSDLFIYMARALTARARGAAAKSAVLASMLFGTVSGGAAANVVVSGAFTIPLMRRAGYPPVVAAAIEAVASSKGQLMPPVMGAGAFVMAEFLGIPYGQIALAALFPALLYFISLWFAVDIYAIRHSARLKVQEETRDIGDLRTVLAQHGHLLLPIGALIGFLAAGYTPFKAVFWAIVLTPLVDALRRRQLPSLGRFADALAEGARNSVMLAVACAASGVIVGVISLTGVGLVFSSELQDLSGGLLLPGLVLTAAAAIILSMGMPTTAAYIVTATLGAPALVQMGVAPLAAHMFVFYFSALSPVTPPVALGSYAAAALADADPWQVSIQSFVYALVGFTVPFLFVYDPALLLSAPVQDVALAVVSGLAGVYLFVAGIQGHYVAEAPGWLRLVLVVAGLVLIYPGLATDLLGVALALLAYLLQRRGAQAPVIRA